MQCLIARCARCARCDVRWVAAVFVGADEKGKHCSAHLLLQIGGANIAAPFYGLLAHRAWESAAVVVAREGKNASARFSSVRRRAIPDAVFDCSLRSLRCSLGCAVFVGADETEKRCSAISSCRSAPRTLQPYAKPHASPRTRRRVVVHRALRRRSSR